MLRRLVVQGKSSRSLLCGAAMTPCSQYASHAFTACACSRVTAAAVNAAWNVTNRLVRACFGTFDSIVGTKANA